MRTAEAREKLEKMMDELVEVAEGSKPELCRELERAHQHVHMAYIKLRTLLPPYKELEDG